MSAAPDVDPAARLAALDDALVVLACPVCAGALARQDRTLRCDAGHAFDIARQGYASLVVGGRPVHRGDTAAMVHARAAFLAAGHHDAIVDAIADHVVPPSAVDRRGARPGGPWYVDLAGGTGWYLARVLDRVPDAHGLALDVAPAAARAAARSHPRTASVTADAWSRLPVGTGGVAHVLSVFGPRNADEIARILTPGGRVTIAAAAPDHMRELRAPFGLIGVGDDKDRRLAAAFAGFDLVRRDTVRTAARLSRDDVVNEVLMGPSAFHLERDAVHLAASALPGDTTVTIHVTVTTFATRAAP